MNTFIHQEWQRKDREQLYTAEERQRTTIYNTTDAKKCTHTRNKIKHQSPDDADMYLYKFLRDILAFG